MIPPWKSYQLVPTIFPYTLTSTAAREGHFCTQCQIYTSPHPSPTQVVTRVRVDSAVSRLSTRFETTKSLTRTKRNGALPFLLSSVYLVFLYRGIHPLLHHRLLGPFHQTNKREFVFRDSKQTTTIVMIHRCVEPP
jgi:hypothetical protein